MNRAHNVNDSVSSIEEAKRIGFDNISIDLIYGLPNQSVEEWRKQLEKAIDMDIQHLSCYCLTVEDRTALKKWVEIGKISVPEDDLQSEHFLIAKEMLGEAGFDHYEISNYAKPGFTSQHNSSYWHGERYLGIGPSSHSFDGSKRRWNVSNNHQYMKLMKSGDYFEFETLSPKDRFNEMILTGFRTSRGVNLELLNSIHEIPSATRQQMKEAQEKGWLQLNNTTMSLTGDGWLMADYISSTFFID
jgi:oxygen-independent coproporphyrinogen-3 oxidase